MLSDKAEQIFEEARAKTNGQTDPRGELRLINPTILEGRAIPLREWVVQDWIPCGVATALYGPGGMGKSLLAQQLITAAAIKKPWLGLPVTQVRSLAVFCEDDADELHRRQMAINRLYGCGFADLDAIRWLPRLGEENVFMTFDRNGIGRATPFAHQIKAAALEHGAKLVIFDTLADGFAGNQNDPGHARQFVQAGLAQLARGIGGAVVALAHPSLTGMNSGAGTSGSVQFDAAFRSRMYLSTAKMEDGESPETDARVLTRKKANYATRDATVELRWSDGVFVTDDDGSDDHQRPDAETVFLSLLDRVTAECQKVSASSRAGNYAPKLFSTRPERQRYHKKDFEMAMQSLFSMRAIRIEEYGTASDRRERIVRC